jgi:mannose-6-phosphate isomerase class I
VAETGPLSLIVLSGSASLNAGSSLSLGKGHVAFVPYNEEYELTAVDGAVIYKAGIPSL